MRTYENKHRKLLEDPNVARWYNNTKRGSIITAEVGLQRLGRVSELFKTTPAKLSKLSVKKATNFLFDLVTEMENDGKQPGTITHHVKVLKSWFKHNEITVTQRIKVGQASIPSKVAQEQSPTPEIVRRILNAADQKQKTEI